MAFWGKNVPVYGVLYHFFGELLDKLVIGSKLNQLLSIKHRHKNQNGNLNQIFPSILKIHIFWPFEEKIYPLKRTTFGSPSRPQYLVQNIFVWWFENLNTTPFRNTFYFFCGMTVDVFTGIWKSKWLANSELFLGFVSSDDVIWRLNWRSCSTGHSSEFLVDSLTAYQLLVSSNLPMTCRTKNYYKMLNMARVTASWIRVPESAARPKWLRDKRRFFSEKKYLLK